MNRAAVPSRQRGASTVEFIAVGFALLLAGLCVIQYALLFSARNTINYAAFEAARAGAYAHADVNAIVDRFATALAPLYGGGRNEQELAQSVARARADLLAHAQVTLLNPTRESFDDWASAELTDSVGQGARTIQNTGIGMRPDAAEIKPSSGQNLYDANVLRFSIVYGYEPSVPIASTLFLSAYRIAGSGLSPIGSATAAAGEVTPAYAQQLAAQGRIPVLVEVTMRMESEPIESAATISNPANGQVAGGDAAQLPPAITPPPPATLADAGPAKLLDGGSGGGQGGHGFSCLPGDTACLPPGCRAGDPSCDPMCTRACCSGAAGLAAAGS
jgi:hypothetical protein